MKKLSVVLSSLLALVPIFVGLILWNKLPEQIPSHWNGAGEIDGYSSRIMVVVGIPLFMFAMHLFALFAIRFDPKHKNHTGGMLNLICWFVPVLSNIVLAISYAVTLGADVDVNTILFTFVGVVFSVIGIFLKTAKRSYTIGLRLPWTLNSDENWVKTHRFASPIWIVSGILTAVCGILGFTWAIMIILLSATLIPTVYSFILYTKGI